MHTPVLPLGSFEFQTVLLSVKGLCLAMTDLVRFSGIGHRPLGLASSNEYEQRSFEEIRAYRLSRSRAFALSSSMFLTYGDRVSHPDVCT